MEYVQHADAKFERRDPFPHIPFAPEEFQMPDVSEALAWTFLAACLLVLFYGFLGL